MSDWYALELIERSFEDVKQLLLPFDFKKMLKMAVVVLFAGGSIGGMSNMSGTASDIAGQTGGQSGGSIANSFMTGGMTGMISAEAALPGIILLVGLLVFGWVIAGSIMKFVFVQICSSNEVTVWDRFKNNFGNGIRLLGFQIIVALTGIILVGVPVGLLVFANVSNLAAGGLAILIAIPVILAIALVNLLTGDFVIVDMLDSDRGVTGSWKGIGEDLKGGWKQIAVYVLLKIGLMIGAGLIVGIASVMYILASVLVFGILGVIGYGLYSIIKLVGIVYFILLGITGIVTLVVGMLFIRVPVDTFFRYYSIRVLEKLVDRELIA